MLVDVANQQIYLDSLLVYSAKRGLVFMKVYGIVREGTNRYKLLVETAEIHNGRVYYHRKRTLRVTKRCLVIYTLPEGITFYV